MADLRQVLLDGHFFSTRPPGLSFAALPLYVVLHAARVAWDRLPAVSAVLPSGRLRCPPRTAIDPFTLWARLWPRASAHLLLIVPPARGSRSPPGWALSTAVCSRLSPPSFSPTRLSSSHYGLVDSARGRRAVSAFWRLEAATVTAATWLWPALSGLLLSGLADRRRSTRSASSRSPPGDLCALSRGRSSSARRGLHGWERVRRKSRSLLAFDQWAFGSLDTPGPTRYLSSPTPAKPGTTWSDGRTSASSGSRRLGHLGHDARICSFTRKGLPPSRRPFVAAARRRPRAALSAWTTRGGFAGRLDEPRDPDLRLGLLPADASGGDGAGMRFLIPSLPLLVSPLAAAFRRWPAPTIALAAVSALSMLGAVTTNPMLGDDHTGVWYRDALHGRFTGDAPLAGGRRARLALPAAVPGARPRGGGSRGGGIAAPAPVAGRGCRCPPRGRGLGERGGGGPAPARTGRRRRRGGRDPPPGRRPRSPARARGAAALPRSVGGAPARCSAVPDVRSSAAGRSVAVVTLGAGWLAAGIPGRSRRLARNVASAEGRYEAEETAS